MPTHPKWKAKANKDNKLPFAVVAVAAKKTVLSKCVILAADVPANRGSETSRMSWLLKLEASFSSINSIQIPLVLADVYQTMAPFISGLSPPQVGK